MAHDDEAPHPGSIDPAVARGNTSGSTTPPVDSGGSTDIHDDDALADALAAEYSSLATAAIPVVTQPVPGSGSASGEDWLSRMFDESEPDVTPAEDAGVAPSLVAAASNDESSTESSGEALSATMTRAPSAWASTLGKKRRKKSAPFQFKITTATSDAALNEE